MLLRIIRRRTMSASRPVTVEESRHRDLTRAVDLAGQVWVHPDPIELYRFIRARNLLLEAILTGFR
jgi:hypothetical protein